MMVKFSWVDWRGKGGRKPGRKGTGCVWEAGVEGTGSRILKVAVAREMGKLHNIVLCFSIEKGQRGRTR